MRKLVLLMTAIVLVNYLSAQTARGRVFEDGNRNGKCDMGERGIAKVAVSNGVEVVLTDKKGAYSINIPENSILFVIKPAEYQYPLNEMNLPQFCYRYYPGGGPKLSNPVIEATGPLPAEIDFPLIPGKKNDNFRAVILGDTQIGDLSDLDFLSRDIVAGLAVDQEFAFCTVLGDLVHDNFALYEPLNRVMSALDIPMHHVQGNHDQNYDAPGDKLATESFKQVYGPKNYACNYGMVHVVVLDNILYSGDTIRRSYVEGFDDEAVNFLINDLKYVSSDKLVMIMTHAPFINDFNQKPVVNLDKVLATLERFPHTFSISGHNHTISQYLLGKEQGWNGTVPYHHFVAGAACGSWWSGAFDESGIPDATMTDGSPNGYAIVTFTGNSYSVDYQVARRPAGYRMKIYTAPVTSRKSIAEEGNDLFVNFFTGSDNDLVTARFDEGPEIILNRAVQADPEYVHNFQLWMNPEMKLNGRKPSRPANCRHLWKTAMPPDLVTGMHKVEVTVTDVFGRKFMALHFFRISE
jgi:hypothetical protein